MFSEGGARPLNPRPGGSIVPYAATPDRADCTPGNVFAREALFGLDAGAIWEIVRLGALTSVRNAPPDVAGIVNLRVKIHTLFDLGLRLRFPKTVPAGTVESSLSKTTMSS